MQRMMLGLCSLPLRGGKGGGPVAWTHSPGKYRQSSFTPLKALNNLYQGATIGSGFSESEMKNKVRRKWKPNAQKKRLYSEVLQETVRVYVTNRALRTVRKHGGLDEYLLSCSYKTLGNGFASELKQRVETAVKTGMDPLAAHKKRREEAFALARKDYEERRLHSIEMKKKRELNLAVELTMGPYPAFKGEFHEKLVQERAKGQERTDLFNAIQLQKKQLEKLEDEAREILLRLPQSELDTLSKEIQTLDELPDNNTDDYFNIFDDVSKSDENFTQKNHLVYPRNKDKFLVWPTGPGGTNPETSNHYTEPARGS